MKTHPSNIFFHSLLFVLNSFLTPSSLVIFKDFQEKNINSVVMISIPETT